MKRQLGSFIYQPVWVVVSRKELTKKWRAASEGAYLSFERAKIEMKILQQRSEVTRNGMATEFKVERYVCEMEV